MKNDTKQSIYAIVAMTIDGKIALNKNHLTDWTSPEDKDSMHALLDKSDVLIVGHNTYKIAFKPLSKRNCIVFTKTIKDTKRENNLLLFCNPRKVTMKTLLNKYRKVAVLGGAETYTYFLEHDLLDELYVTIEPIVFGKGLHMFNDTNHLPITFSLISAKKLNKTGSVLLHYKKSNVKNV